MRTVAMLANLLIHYLIVKMTVENSVQNVKKVLGRMRKAMAECQTHSVLLPLKTYTQEEALNG
jgi:hypothetical protein